MQSLDKCIKYITGIYPIYNCDIPHKWKKDIRTQLNNNGWDSVYLEEYTTDKTVSGEYIRIYDDGCCVFDSSKQHIEILNPSNIKKVGDIRYMFFKKLKRSYGGNSYGRNPFPPR